MNTSGLPLFQDCYVPAPSEWKIPGQDLVMMDFLVILPFYSFLTWSRKLLLTVFPSMLHVTEPKETEFAPPLRYVEWVVVSRGLGRGLSMSLRHLEILVSLF